jgi:hypothetical protein
VSSLEEGDVGAVGEKPPQEKLSHKMKPSTALGRRKIGTHVGYSG